MFMGNIHLSHDVSRLGFIKVFVFLTHPTTRMGSGVLLDRYYARVSKHRDSDQWMADKVGRGIGKMRPSQDTISKNHLNLTVDLDFLRRDLNTWGKYGFALASLFLKGTGNPVFYEEAELEKELSKRGLVATLERGEQLVFSTSLISKDPDGIFPLLLLLSRERPSDTRTVVEQYFDEVAQWYSRKSQVEPDGRKQIGCLEGEHQFAKKARDLRQETEFKQTVRETHVHCTEQVAPRLEYLYDLGYVSREGRSYLLTDFGESLKKWALSLFEKNIKRGEKPLIAKVLDEELSLLSELSVLYGSGLAQSNLDDFRSGFSAVSSYFANAGSAILSYENTFLCLAAIAANEGRRLSLATYEQGLEGLAEKKFVSYSNLVAERRYIKLLRRSSFP